LLHSSCTLVHSGVRSVTSLISLQFVKKCLFRLGLSMTKLRFNYLVVESLISQNWNCLKSNCFGNVLHRLFLG